MFKMDRFFISIPLRDTPVEMGPTIFYSEEDLKILEIYMFQKQIK